MEADVFHQKSVHVLEDGLVITVNKVQYIRTYKYKAFNPLIQPLLQTKI